MSHEQTLCEGGDTVDELVVDTSTKATFTGLDFGTMTAAVKDGLVGATCTATKEEVAAVATGATVSIKSCTGSGGFAGASPNVSRRRLSKRRLANHEGIVDTIIASKIAAANAGALKTSISTAVDSGALTAANLKTKIVEKIEADNTLAAVAANISTALMVETPEVSEPAIPPPVVTTTTTGSTSGSVAEYLSFTAALVFGAALLM